MNDYITHKWREFLDSGDALKAIKNNSIKQSLLIEAGKSNAKYGGTKRGKTVKPSKVGKKTLNIPYPTISDAWGEPGNKDRAEVENLLRKVATGNTWQAKIDNLNQFADSCKKESSCLNQADSTILSKLMAMDILVSIVYDFDASTSGFLFESFLAALLGGDSEKIIASQSRTGGAAGNIADVNLLGKPFSLKLIRKGASSINGSYADLIGTIIRDKNPVPYMVALKDLKKSDPPVIRFYEFTVGSSAIVPGEDGNLIHDPKRFGQNPGLAGYVDVDDPNLDVIRGTEFQIPTAILKGTTKHMGATTRKEKNRRKAAAAKEFQSETAVLNLGSKESLRQLAESYAQKISEDVVSIYDALDDLSSNINGYLIGSQISSGKEARKNANVVAYRTDKLIKAQEEPEE